MKKLFYLVIKCRNQQLTIKNYLAHVQSMQVNNQINITLLLNKQKKGMVCWNKGPTGDVACKMGGWEEWAVYPEYVLNQSSATFFCNVY